METSKVLAPILGEFSQKRLVLDAAGFLLCSLELSADRVGFRLRVRLADIIRVDLPEWRVILNLFVKQGLGDGRIVHLTVAMPAVADEINHNVSAELIAKFSSQAGDADDGINVFGVDMEYGDRLAPSDAGCEARRMLLGVTGREAEKIVDHDVNRAAHGVSRKIGVVHGFGENSLTGERGIAMHQQWKVFLASAFACAILLAARACSRHMLAGFHMAPIGYRLHRTLAAS